MVQSGRGPRTVACISHTQADNGGARGTLPRRTIPRREHPDIRDARQHRRLCTYGGGGRVGGVETTGHRSGGPSRMRAKNLREWLR